MKITLWAHATGYGRVGEAEREIDVDDADWEGMSENEKHEYMLFELWNQGLIVWGWDVNEGKA